MESSGQSRPKYLCFLEKSVNLTIYTVFRSQNNLSISSGWKLSNTSNLCFKADLKQSNTENLDFYIKKILIKSKSILSNGHLCGLLYIINSVCYLKLKISNKFSLLISIIQAAIRWDSWAGL
jgi:hypothetical protein